jgi:ribosomal protein S18 acetylase RimI-like enzyme
MEIASLPLAPAPRPALIAPPTVIRPLRLSDRASLEELIRRAGLFQAEEVTCALELIDAALADPDRDYTVRVADEGGRISGYVCFGPTPMTRGTWDMYWIVTDPEWRGRGVGSALVEAMEAELRRRGARLVRVETSHLDEYGAAHRFYARHRYPVIARLPDFYKPGDDLVVMLKQL